MIYVSNPVLETWIVSSLLFLAIIFSFRKRKDKELFPLSVTQELKGIAILAIVFAHIGYSLSADQRFLWPLSTMAGVGVNMFLFLSGYGLTSSSLRRKLSIRQFYSRRLKKLYLPFWIILGIYFIADFLLLERSYTVQYVMLAFAGIFQTADVVNDVNSPLWFFTIIAFYYLIYPLVFIKKYPWLSAIIIYLITSLLLKYSNIGSYDAARLYELYTIAFPLGIFISWLHFKRHGLRVLAAKAVARTGKLANAKSALMNYSQNKVIKNSPRYILLLSLVLVCTYSAYYPGTGDSPDREQLINVLTMLCLVLIFLLKRTEIKLFYIFGVYSYEIYLLHWPLLFRYDVIFSHTYAWLGVTLYLMVFLALGWALNKLPAMQLK